MSHAVPPVLHTSTQKNGLRTVVASEPGTGVVAMQVWVGVGSADETEAQGGLAHVHEHMLFKGTSERGPHGGSVRRGVGEIASTIEGAGGDINAWTSYDQTVYHVVIQKDLAEVGFDVLADAVLRSSFDAGELSRELEVILEEIKRGDDNPSQKASRALFSSVFAAHPYRRPVIGYADVVRGFTREHIVDFFDAHYRSDRMTVVVVGDIEPDAAQRMIECSFADARTGARPLPPRAREQPQTATRAAVLREDIEESQLLLGFRGPSLLDDDMPAVDVLAVVLGQGESSRLVQRVKRARQVCNDAYAYAYTPRDPGVVAVGAHLHHDKVEACLPALVHELARMRDEKPRAQELEKAKAVLASEAVYQRETVEGLARRLGTWMSATGEPGYEKVYQERVQGVTAADVQRVAQKLFTPEQANIVALLPRDQAMHITEQLLTDAVQPMRSPRRTRASSDDDVMRVQLDSGARVIIERDTRNPIVTVRAAWLGGQRAEDDARAGVCALCADLVVKGTDKLSASTIHETMDAMASNIDGFAGRNSFGMRGTFLKPHAERGLDVFFASLRDAAFAEDELERTRALVLEDLRTKADNPSGLAFDRFNKALWPSHPYRRDISGTPDSVSAATSEGLRTFWRTHATTPGMVLSFVGDVDPDEVLSLLEDALPARAASTFAQPARDPPPAVAQVIRLEKDRAQAHLVTGVLGMTLDDPDKTALELLTSALSGQGGRLFLELRDRQSLCYSVSAFSVEGVDPGSFSVYMGTSPDKVDTALAGINRLLADVAEHGLTDDEIARSQRYLVGAHQIGLQRLGARGSAMTLSELYGLGHLNHRTYPTRIRAVTAADVRRVAARVLGQPRITAIVGPKGTGGPPAT